MPYTLPVFDDRDILARAAVAPDSMRALSPDQGKAWKERICNRRMTQGPEQDVCPGKGAVRGYPEEPFRREKQAIDSEHDRQGEVDREAHDC